MPHRLHFSNTHTARHLFWNGIRFMAGPGHRGALRALRVLGRDYRPHTRGTLGPTGSRAEVACPPVPPDEREHGAKRIAARPRLRLPVSRRPCPPVRGRAVRPRAHQGGAVRLCLARRRRERAPGPWAQPPGMGKPHSAGMGLTRAPGETYPPGPALTRDAIYRTQRRDASNTVKPDIPLRPARPHSLVGASAAYCEGRVPWPGAWGRVVPGQGTGRSLPGLAGHPTVMQRFGHTGGPARAGLSPPLEPGRLGHRAPSKAEARPPDARPPQEGESHRAPGRNVFATRLRRRVASVSPRTCIRLRGGGSKSRAVHVQMTRPSRHLYTAEIFSRSGAVPAARLADREGGDREDPQESRTKPRPARGQSDRAHRPTPTPSLAAQRKPPGRRPAARRLELRAASGTYRQPVAIPTHPLRGLRPVGTGGPGRGSKSRPGQVQMTAPVDVSLPAEIRAARGRFGDGRLYGLGLTAPRRRSRLIRLRWRGHRSAVAGR
jgi:hypothetical protein